MASAETEYKLRRRKIWAGGGLAAVLLFAGGAYFFDTRIEDDLETRVPAALADQGFDGAKAKFSGQDGTLSCTTPFSDPPAAEEVARGVRGVNKIKLDASCRANAPAATQPTEATTTTAAEPSVDYNTVGEALSGNPEYSSFSDRVSESTLVADINDASAGPYTLFAPSGEAMEAVPDDQLAVLDSQPDLQDQVLGYHVVEGSIGLDQLTDGAELKTVNGDVLTVSGDGENAKVAGASIIGGPITTNNGLVYTIDTMLLPDGINLTPADTGSVAGTLADGTITLDGVIASEAERATLVDAATAKVGADKVTDNLVVDAVAGIDAATAADVATLIDGMADHLVAGEAGYADGALYVRGQYPSEEDNAAMTQIAAGVEATATLEAAPAEPAPDDTPKPEDLEALLNAYLAENPILFEPNSAELSPESAAVIDRVAADLVKQGNLNIVVEGHTDSDGEAERNKTLSEERAAVVASELIARGVPAENITSVGYGEEQPIVVDGVEDKAASRRVMFQLTAAS